MANGETGTEKFTQVDCERETHAAENRTFRAELTPTAQLGAPHIDRHHPDVAPSDATIEIRKQQSASEPDSASACQSSPLKRGSRHRTTLVASVHRVLVVIEEHAIGQGRSKLVEELVRSRSLLDSDTKGPGLRVVCNEVSELYDDGVVLALSEDILQVDARFFRALSHNSFTCCRRLMLSCM